MPKAITEADVGAEADAEADGAHLLRAEVKARSGFRNHMPRTPHNETKVERDAEGEDAEKVAPCSGRPP